jgi:hypothetical protein
MNDRAETYVQAAIALEDGGQLWRAEQEYRKALQPSEVARALTELRLSNRRVADKSRFTPSS